MNESEIAFQGDLYLWWSLRIPDSTIPPLPTLSDEVKQWISQEFICGKIDELASVRIIKDVLLTSACRDVNIFNNTSRRQQLTLPSDMTILWNAPSANVTVEVLDSYNTNWTYTRWNVSFPVYEWGPGNDSRVVQRDLQDLLERKIWSGDLDMPWDGSLLSITGNEAYFFIEQPGIEAGDAKNMITIGGLLFLIHTILLGLLHVYGKGQVAFRQETKQLMKQRERVDDMLYLSKGFVAIEAAKEEPPPDLSSAEKSSGPSYALQPSRDMTQYITQIADQIKSDPLKTKKERRSSTNKKPSFYQDKTQDITVEADQENQIAERIKSDPRKTKKKRRSSTNKKTSFYQDKTQYITLEADQENQMAERIKSDPLKIKKKKRSSINKKP
jgi:hypothetical protein